MDETSSILALVSWPSIDAKLSGHLDLVQIRREGGQQALFLLSQRGPPHPAEL